MRAAPCLGSAVCGAPDLPEIAQALRRDALGTRREVEGLDREPARVFDIGQGVADGRELERAHAWIETVGIVDLRVRDGAGRLGPELADGLGGRSSFVGERARVKVEPEARLPQHAQAHGVGRGTRGKTGCPNVYGATSTAS